MNREVYSPNMQLPFETSAERDALQNLVGETEVTDEQLIQFNEDYFATFRSTVDEFFPPLAKFLSLYANYPFRTTIVRLGKTGLIVVHKQSPIARTEIRQLLEFAKADGTTNLFDIAAQLQADHCWFDATPSSYTSEDARIRAVQDVLKHVLQFFWHSIPNTQLFRELCEKLIRAEGVTLDSKDLSEMESPIRCDFLGHVVLHEPAGYRRPEIWGFEFKHIVDGRFSAAHLLLIENAVAEMTLPDVICLVTSDDLTTIGRHILLDNPRIRVWDRDILNRLVNRHLDVLREYFEAYPSAVEELSRRLEQRPPSPGRAQEFGDALRVCPSGKESYAEFERIGIELLGYLFPEALGLPKPQERTIDGKQRRDVLFRNKRLTSFFERIFHRFDSDVIIVDFKNFGEEISSGIITDVDKYANKALGRFVLVVSRKGEAASAVATQLRVFRDSNTIVLVIGDQEMLEMVSRKDQGLPPEDVLEDKLDEVLAKY